MEQMRIRHRNRKGVLLTLVTVVLVLLMVGEILMFIYGGLQYSTLALQASPSASASSFYATIQSSLGSFLRSSLSTAITTLSTYETTNNLILVNDTQYALTSLVNNGTLYSVSMTSYMGNSIIAAYIANMTNQARTQGLTLTITNKSLVIYQSSPYSINASFFALASINSSTGLLIFPISTNVSVNLQGTADLYGSYSGMPHPFLYSNASNVNSAANVLPISGSRSQYLFAYGPLAIDNVSGTPSCTDAYVANFIYNKSQYILATTNAVNIANTVCGFGGLVTNYLNSTPPLKPYLVYAASFNVLSGFPYWGRYLLDGNSLTLVDPVQFESAISGQYYLQSGYSPSYLQLASGSQLWSSPYGIAPLGTSNRQVANFNQYENVSVSNLYTNTTPFLGNNTVSLWLQQISANSPVIPLSFISPNSYYLYIGSNRIGISTGGNVISSQANAIYAQLGEEQFVNNTWIHVVATFPNGPPTTSNVLIYVNGVKEPLLSAGTPSNSFASTKISIGGQYLNGLNPFNGRIADVQLYNSLLTPYQIAALYTQGINARPITLTGLVGWWPLSGNATDFSTFKNNGYANVIANGLVYSPHYARLYNYMRNTLSGGAAYNSRSDRLNGISQCYNLANCGSAPGQIYLPIPTSYSSSNLEKPSSYFGFSNNTVPSVAMFDEGQNSYIQAYNVLTNANGGQYNTVSFWMATNTPENNPGTPFYFNTYGVSTLGGCFGLSASNNANVMGVNVLGVAGTGTGRSGNWINIVAEFYQGSFTSANDRLYINGALAPTTCASGSTGLSLGNPGATVTIGATPSASSPFAGAIADVQVFNTVLTQNQIWNLYLNNSISGVLPAGSWPLSSGYNGNLNQTPTLIGNTIGGNVIGYIKKNGGFCTNANALNATANGCGVEFLPRDLPD